MGFTKHSFIKGFILKLFYYEKWVIILNDITHSILWILLETKGVHTSYSYKAIKYDFINYLNSTNTLEKGFKVNKMSFTKLV